ncbi:hypothetical protein NPIL_372321 [Nephila pilipes]|uniref:Uncharacterized protein n=1 Tax=Nephila pilipes TaxID=299642 RepID=A0A8X6PVV0_NEPPI|nr:hypothetical protein NPIL_372321 [Nephila pilipes]
MRFKDPSLKTIHFCQGSMFLPLNGGVQSGGNASLVISSPRWLKIQSSIANAQVVEAPPVVLAPHGTNLHSQQQHPLIPLPILIFYPSKKQSRLR